MDKESRRRRILAALQRKQFPPSLAVPENEDYGLPAQLFQLPVLVWVPECHASAIRCPRPNCVCSPSIRGYKSRIVDDIDHRTMLLFCKYQCNVSHEYFQTISSSFLDAQPAEIWLRFQYVMSHKYGVSKSLMTIIHSGITSRQGLRAALEDVKKQRASRYIILTSLFSQATRRQKHDNPSYIASLPQSYEEYSENHRLNDQDTLSKMWLTWSEIYSALCEMVMNAAEVRKLVRIDHSRKFARLLKNYSDKGAQIGVKMLQLLLLAQNECGQVVARAFTASENNVETKALLRERVLPRIGQGEHIHVVSDNANAVRGLIVDAVFQSSASVKQDPFHVIQRFTDKVRQGNERKRVAKELSAAFYSPNGQLRDTIEMASRVTLCLASVDMSSISCTTAVWEGTIASNLEQIRRGDLYVSENVYREGAKSAKIVSTSQLEGVHSKLRKALAHPVSVGIGARVLDIFILEHNLLIGGRWGRNPHLGQTDFVQLCQSALLCNGIVPESPAYAFALDILSRDTVEHRYRLTSAYDFPFRRWLGVFSESRPETDAVQLHAHPRPKYSILEMMSRYRSSVRVKDMKRSALAQALLATVDGSEASGPFSENESELLKQVRREMRKFQAELSPRETDWTSCSMATTVLFNVAVSASESTKLSLMRRGYSSIVKAIPSVDALLAREKQRATDKVQLFSFRVPSIDDVEHTAHEHAVQWDLFRALKSTLDVRHRKTVFARVYWLAACLSEHLNGKSAEILKLRWETMTTSDRRKRHRDGSVADNPKLLELHEVSVSHGEAGEIQADAVSEMAGKSTPAMPEATEIFPVSSVDAAPEHRSPSSFSASITLAPIPDLNSATENDWIKDEDLESLRALAQSLPRRKGKLLVVYKAFKVLYPLSSLTMEALRCRLKAKPAKKRARVKPFPPHSTTPHHQVLDGHHATCLSSRRPNQLHR